MQQLSGNTGTKRHCGAIHLEGTAQGKSAKPWTHRHHRGRRGRETFTQQAQHNPAPGGQQVLMNKPTEHCGSSIQRMIMPAVQPVSASSEHASVRRSGHLVCRRSRRRTGINTQRERTHIHTHTHLHDSFFLFSFLSLLLLLFSLLLHLGFPDGREIEGGLLMS